MGKRFAAIDASHREFIQRQHIFFTGSAAQDGRVNVSPKDAAALRVLGPNQVAYLDVTGSGNETTAHLLRQNRLTLLFCAFDGAPTILRLYGQGRVLPRGSAEYRDLLNAEYGGEERPGARQIIFLDVEMIQTSCGYGVPLFDYAGDRDTLTRWAQSKGEQGLEEYWRMKNTVSIDGFPTGILEAQTRAQ